MQTFLRRIKEFGSFSGLCMNDSKTKLMWLGNTPQIQLKHGFHFSNEPIKTLGIYLSWNLTQANLLSISKKINNIKNIIHAWKHRKLTFRGKITVLKSLLLSLLLSQIVHLTLVLPFSKETIREIEGIFYDFLWSESTHKVKKSVIIQDVRNGGHGMLDLSTFILTQKLKWIRLYLENHNAHWRVLMESLINVKNLNVFLRSNFSWSDKLTKSPFYSEVLYYLGRVKKLCEQNKVDKLLTQLVFYNKHLKINGQVQYDSELFSAGLWRVKDLFNDDNTIIPFHVWQRRGVSKSKFMLWRSIVNLIRSLRIDMSCCIVE